MVTCVVAGCPNGKTKTRLTRIVRYFSFPKDPYYKKIWYDACGKREVIFIREPSICSNHFEESCMDVPLHVKSCRRYLRADAVPTLALPTTLKRRAPEIIAPIQKVEHQAVNLYTSSLKQNPEFKRQMMFANDINIKNMELKVINEPDTGFVEMNSFQIKNEPQDDNILQEDIDDSIDIKEEPISEYSEEKMSVDKNTNCISFIKMESKEFLETNTVIDNAILEKIVKRLSNMKNSTEWKAFLNSADYVIDG